MPPPSTFFRRLRLIWVGVNIGILAVTSSDYLDLSGLTFMLSFPAAAIVLLLLPPEVAASGGRGPFNNVLIGSIAFISGYVQWFVIGRAIARRILARFPSQRLLNVARIGVVVALLGLTFFGVVLVGAHNAENQFIRRALTVHNGMTVDEVRAIVGDPKSDAAATTENSLCPAGTARIRDYWYEHEWLPRGGFFLMRLCFNPEGMVIGRQTGHVN